MGKLTDKFGAASLNIQASGQGGTKRGPIPAASTAAIAVQRDNAVARAENAEAEVGRLAALLEDAKGSGGALDIALTDLQEVPGRRRKLTAEEFSELKDNLSRHELITPITVRPVGNGKFEIISGHNRVAAYRELGRETIKAWPADADENKIDELAFYANLLHPDLTDFEKYQGFTLISERAGLKTAEELGERTGLSPRHIRRLLSFGSLPPEAIKLLDVHPAAIGANAAEALAKLAAKGMGIQVIEAIKKVAEGEVTEQQAIKLASATPKQEKKKPAPMTIKSGAAIYCRMHAAEKVLRLEFATPEQREAAQAAVAEVLERLKEKSG
jgi:ParB family chromosome partitioning protein